MQPKKIDTDELSAILRGLFLYVDQATSRHQINLTKRMIGEISRELCLRASERIVDVQDHIVQSALFLLEVDPDTLTPEETQSLEALAGELKALEKQGATSDN